MKFFEEFNAIYGDLILEDYESSLNTAKKILSNNLSTADLDEAIRDVEAAYSGVDIKDPNNRKNHVDVNLPTLALLYVKFKSKDGISLIYNKYVNNSISASERVFPAAFNFYKNEVQNAKLFKPELKFERLTLIDRIITTLCKKIEVADQYLEREKERSSEPRQGKADKTDDLVYEDDNVKIFLADSKQKCIQHGENTDLCIAATTGENYYWRYRMGSFRGDGYGMSTYFIYQKDENGNIDPSSERRYLVDVFGNEDGPKKDEPKYSLNEIQSLYDGEVRDNNHDYEKTTQQLLKDYPELKPAIDSGALIFHPYTEEEQKYFKIDQEVETVDDITLETLLDYEMFIDSGKEINSYGWEFLEETIPSRILKDFILKYVGLDGRYIDYNFVKKYLKNVEMRRFESHILKNRHSLKKYLISIIDSDEEKIPDYLLDQIKTSDLAFDISIALLRNRKQVNLNLVRQFVKKGYAIEEWVEAYINSIGKEIPDEILAEMPVENRGGYYFYLLKNNIIDESKISELLTNDTMFDGFLEGMNQRFGDAEYYLIKDKYPQIFKKIITYPSGAFKIWNNVSSDITLPNEILVSIARSIRYAKLVIEYTIDGVMDGSRAVAIPQFIYDVLDSETANTMFRYVIRRHIKDESLYLNLFRNIQKEWNDDFGIIAKYLSSIATEALDYGVLLPKSINDTIYNKLLEMVHTKSINVISSMDYGGTFYRQGMKYLLKVIPINEMPREAFKYVEALFGSGQTYDLASDMVNANMEIPPEIYKGQSTHILQAIASMLKDKFGSIPTYFKDYLLRSGKFQLIKLILSDIDVKEIPDEVINKIAEDYDACVEFVKEYSDPRDISFDNIPTPIIETILDHSDPISGFVASDLLIKDFEILDRMQNSGNFENMLGMIYQENQLASIIDDSNWSDFEPYIERYLKNDISKFLKFAYIVAEESGRRYSSTKWNENLDNLIVDIVRKTGDEFLSQIQDIYRAGKINLPKEMTLALYKTKNIDNITREIIRTMSSGNIRNALIKAVSDSPSSIYEIFQTDISLYSGLNAKQQKYLLNKVSKYPDTSKRIFEIIKRAYYTLPDKFVDAIYDDKDIKTELIKMVFRSTNTKISEEMKDKIINDIANNVYTSIEVFNLYFKNSISEIPSPIKNTLENINPVDSITSAFIGEWMGKIQFKHMDEYNRFVEADPDSACRDIRNSIIRMSTPDDPQLIQLTDLFSENMIASAIKSTHFLDVIHVGFKKNINMFPYLKDPATAYVYLDAYMDNVRASYLNHGDIVRDNFGQIMDLLMSGSTEDDKWFQKVILKNMLHAYINSPEEGHIRMMVMHPKTQELLNIVIKNDNTLPRLVNLANLYYDAGIPIPDVLQSAMAAARGEPGLPPPNLNLDSFSRECDRLINKLLREKVSYNEVDESMLEEAKIIRPLSDFKFMDIANDMIDIENKQFTSGYASGYSELSHDLRLGGFVGVSIYDEEKGSIGGYIYGYRMGEDGEYDDVDQMMEYKDQLDIKVFDQRMRSIQSEEDFIEFFSPNKTIYVSNFAVLPEYRYGVKKMLETFFQEIKRQGYQYLVFDGMPDTMNLIMRGGSFRSGRLEKAGLNIMAVIPNPEMDGRSMSIAELR